MSMIDVVGGNGAPSVRKQSEGDAGCPYIPLFVIWVCLPLDACTSSAHFYSPHTYFFKIISLPSLGCFSQAGMQSYIVLSGCSIFNRSSIEEVLRSFTLMDKSGIFFRFLYYSVASQ